MKKFDGYHQYVQKYENDFLGMTHEIDYYTPEKRSQCEIIFDSDYVYIGSKQNKKRLTTADKIEWVELPDSKHANKTKFYIRHMADETTQHSYIAAGQRVLCAGQITVKNGKVVYIDNQSGHYKPAAEHFIYSVSRIPLNMFSKNVCFGIQNKSKAYIEKLRLELSTKVLINENLFNANKKTQPYVMNNNTAHQNIYFTFL